MNIVPALEGGLAAPQWLSATEDAVVAAPSAGTPVGIYGPYVVEAVAAGFETKRSEEFSIDVAAPPIASAATVRPVRGQIANSHAAVSMHGNPSGNIASIVDLAYDRANNSIVTHTGDKSVLSLSFDQVVSVDTCYVRFLSTTLPSPTSFSLNFSVVGPDGTRVYRNERVSVARGGGNYFTINGPCFAEGVNVDTVSIGVLGPNSSSITYSLVEFRVGKGGVYP